MTEYPCKGCGGEREYGEYCHDCLIKEWEKQGNTGYN